MNKRIVITGMGVVSPIGLNRKTFGASLRQGISGLGPIQSFDPSGYPFKQAFEVKNFNPSPFGVHLLDPFIQYAIAAAHECLEDSGFDPKAVDPYRIAISVSSSKGGMHTIDRFKERFQKHPSAILGARIYANSVPNFAAQWIARRWKINGPARCYIAACATGTTAVIEGAQTLLKGEADYCLAGASDASVVPLLLCGYYNMRALARGDMRPFDQRRSGFLVGEGAGILLLETLESAKARKAKIYAEIAGWAYGSDGTNALHFSPSENALSRTVRQLLQNASLTPEKIDYVNLHGTGTVEGDIYETDQLKKVFGKHAYKIPMSSTKSMTGHMLGASGAVEIIASALAMQEGFIPPTVGLEKSDPACDLNYTPKPVLDAKLRHTASVSMGFGGHVAAIALRNPE